jgi:hypothetical protein
MKINIICIIFIFCSFLSHAQKRNYSPIIGLQSSHNVKKGGEIIFALNIFFGISYNKWSFSGQLEHVGFFHGPKNKMIGFQTEYRFLKENVRISPIIRFKASTSIYSPYKNHLVTSNYYLTNNESLSSAKFQTINYAISPEFLLDIKNDNWSVQVGSGYGNFLLSYITNQEQRRVSIHSWQINLGLTYTFRKLNGILLQKY